MLTSSVTSDLCCNFLEHSSNNLKFYRIKTVKVCVYMYVCMCVSREFTYIHRQTNIRLVLSRAYRLLKEKYGLLVYKPLVLLINNDSSRFMFLSSTLACIIITASKHRTSCVHVHDVQILTC